MDTKPYATEHSEDSSQKASRFDYPILIVDDNNVNLELNQRILQRSGLRNLIMCNDSRDVLGLCEKYAIDIVLLDLMMPHVNGEDLLPEIKSLFPDIYVIVVTALKDIQTIIRCMKVGAFDYVVKPVEKEILFSAIDRALRILSLERENRELRKHSGSLKNPQAFSKIITGSRMMMDIFRTIESIAPSPWPVFVSGETGVGKEMIVRVIHDLSERNGQLVSINAAGLDNQMFSDTLFGHVKGAFTGADKEKKGLLHKAAQGTIFFDEIGDLEGSSQIKLLRLIQEGEFMPLGSEKLYHSDARVITATNQDLWSLQRTGRFRKDLNYRLRTHHIHVPPLRERMEDLPLLVDYFVEQGALLQGKKKPKVPEKLLKRLQAYFFPGNIRELRSLLFDAVSRNQSGSLSVEFFELQLQEQSPEDMGNGVIGDTVGISFPPAALPTLQEMSDLLIQEALKRSNYNQTLAAGILGISQSALSRRLKKNTDS
ncbi:MAG: sigma-54 dependent transcriptional regulator [Desulfobacterales bacterium]